MDVLHDILDTLDLKGVVYFRTHFSAPWATTVPDFQQAARFHLVVQGQCHLSVPGGSEVLLGPGDLALVPGGRAHILADRFSDTAPPLETVLSEAGYDGKGVLVLGEGDSRAATQMICGHLSFRPDARHPLLDALPDLIHVSASDRVDLPILDEVLRLIARRIFSEGAGATAAVTRMSEIVFIEVLRQAIAARPGRAHLLSAFNDRHIGKALALMHAEPARRWTVDELAQAVGMSRSRFSDRFAELTGQSPMAYLADWRLQKALALLGDARCSIQEVANETGYLSPAAFTRAFAGKFGQPPTAYRRSLQAI